MSNTRNVDVAIIGAGTAGMRAYREVSKVTNSVLLIEGDQYGTTCARVGCMPSKLLIAAAEAAHFGQQTKPFGVTYDPPKIDGKAVMDRVRKERDRFVGFVVETVEDWPQEHRICGYARFKSDHVLQVGETEITAKRIVIATGSRTNQPEMLKNFGNHLIVNDDVFYWDDLPQSIAVIGAGVIGLELGQALSRLGVRVTVFGRGNRISPLTDRKVIDKAIKLFTDEFQFLPDATITDSGVSDGKAQIGYTSQGQNYTDHFDLVLAATGRIPNVDLLGLENTTLPLDKRGLPIYDLHTGQIGKSHVFIAGDANNKFPLLHEATDEGMVAGYNAAHFPDIRSFSKSAPISVVFTDPQIMMVGQTYAALSDSEIDFQIGELDWHDQGRSRVMMINKGLIRVYGECNTGRFLGAEMIGPRAEHIAHLLAWAYQSNLTVAEMLERPFYHPVVEEGIRSVLRDLNYKLRMGPKSPPRCIDCGPGS